MMNTGVSRRYATAIVDAAAAQGEAALEQVTKELESFVSMVRGSPDLKHLLLSPTFSTTERERVLNAVLERIGLSELTTRFLKLIGQRNRFTAIDDIARAVRRQADLRANRVRADVQAAAPLSPDAQESLRRALEKRTGKAIDLHIAIDPSLLGGVRTQIGSVVLDGTLRSQLEQLRESLLRAD